MKLGKQDAQDIKKSLPAAGPFARAVEYSDRWGVEGSGFLIPMASREAAEELEIVLNAAHAAALEEERKKAFEEAQKGFLMHCNKCGVDVVMTTEQKLTNEQQGAVEAIRGREGR